MSGSDTYLSGNDYVAGITAEQRRELDWEDRFSWSSFIDMCDDPCLYDDPSDYDQFYDEYDVEPTSETDQCDRFDSDCHNPSWIPLYTEDDTAELERLEEEAADAYYPTQGSHGIEGFGRSKARRYTSDDERTHLGLTEYRGSHFNRKKQRSWKFRKGRPFQWKPDLAPRKLNGTHIREDWAYLAEPARANVYDKAHRRYDKQALVWEENFFVPYTIATVNGVETKFLYDEYDDFCAILDEFSAWDREHNYVSTATTLKNFVDGEWREAEMEDGFNEILVSNEWDSWEYWDALAWEEEKLQRQYEDYVDVYGDHMLGEWSFVGCWVAPDARDLGVEDVAFYSWERAA